MPDSPRPAWPVAHAQAGHCQLIAHILQLVGATRYLELGAAGGETVRTILGWTSACYIVGVDLQPAPLVDLRYLHMQMSTDEFLTMTSDQPESYDAVFIDADHHYEQARSDLLGVLPLVEPHGLIFLHDTYPAEEKWVDQRYCGDVYRLADELRDQKRWPQLEAMTLPYHPGLTIARNKRGRHLAW